MFPSEYSKCFYASCFLLMEVFTTFISNEGHPVRGSNTSGCCGPHRSTHKLIPSVSNKPAADIMGGAGLLTHWMNLPNAEAEQNSWATRNSVRKYKVLESKRPFQTASTSSFSILAAHRKPEEELRGAFVTLGELYSCRPPHRLVWQLEWRNKAGVSSWNM